VNSTVCSWMVAVGWVGLGVVERKMGCYSNRADDRCGVCVAVVAVLELEEVVSALRCCPRGSEDQSECGASVRARFNSLQAGHTYSLQTCRTKKTENPVPHPPTPPPSSLDCAKQLHAKTTVRVSSTFAPRRAGWVVGGCCLLSPPFRSSLPLQYCRSV